MNNTNEKKMNNTNENETDYLNALYTKCEDYFNTMVFVFSLLFLFFILNLSRSTPIFISANFFILSILCMIGSFPLSKKAMDLYFFGKYLESEKINNLIIISDHISYFSMAIGIFVFMVFGYKW